MKKNIYLLIILLSLVGCKDFLEETSQDLVRPSQVTVMDLLIIVQLYSRMNRQVRIWMMNLFNPLMMS